jgi:hypothetical protein
MPLYSERGITTFRINMQSSERKHPTMRENKD